MKNKLLARIGWIKNLLIVLLLVSAVFLGSQTGLFSHLSLDTPLLGSTEKSRPEETAPESPAQAATPLMISVNLPDGSHHGIKYHSEALRQTYESFSGLLGEALGSSGEPVPVTAAQWESALCSSGVFFDFLYPQSLSALANWLGTEMDGDARNHTARRLCLAQDSSGLFLYYIRALDGCSYRCSTALDPQALSSRLSVYPSNSAFFAFEQPDSCGSLDPYSFFTGTLPQLEELNITNPLRTAGTVEGLLALFGMNSYVARQYPEADGTTVFVEGDATLRVSPGGEVSYRQSGEAALTVSAADQIPTAGEVAEAAWSLAAQSIGALCANGEITLSGMGYNTDAETYTVTFDYLSCGLPVRLAGGVSAAEITISGSAITQAHMHFRQFDLSGERAVPLPETQAIAVVQAGNGGEPLLAYLDKGSTAEPKWIINNQS